MPVTDCIASETRPCSQPRVGHPILGNTIGNLVANGIAGSNNPSPAAGNQAQSDYVNGKLDSGNQAYQYNADGTKTPIVDASGNAVVIEETVRSGGRGAIFEGYDTTIPGDGAPSKYYVDRNGDIVIEALRRPNNNQPQQLSTIGFNGMPLDRGEVGDGGPVFNMLFDTVITGGAGGLLRLGEAALTRGASLFASGAAETAAPSTIDLLSGAANRAATTVGPGSGPVYGTAVHSAFQAEVDAFGSSNLATEQSYLNGELVSYGTKGSVRLDVVEGPLSNPTAVYDLKTGSATLTPSRIQQIQSHLPGGSNVPAYEVRP